MTTTFTPVRQPATHHRDGGETGHAPVGGIHVVLFGLALVDLVLVDHLLARPRLPAVSARRCCCPPSTARPTHHDRHLHTALTPVPRERQGRQARSGVTGGTAHAHSIPASLTPSCTRPARRCACHAGCAIVDPPSRLHPPTARRGTGWGKRDTPHLFVSVNEKLQWIDSTTCNPRTTRRGQRSDVCLGTATTLATATHSHHPPSNREVGEWEARGRDRDEWISSGNIAPRSSPPHHSNAAAPARGVPARPVSCVGG
jgi:hypothetical protein